MNQSSYSKFQSNDSKKPIEIDLIDRSLQVKRKIEALKKKRIAEELKYNQEVPTINPTSKKIAKSLEESQNSKDRMKKTQAILRNSRYFPKNITISLKNLSSPANNQNSVSKQKIHSKVSEKDPKASKNSFSITFPSLDNLQKPNSSNFPLDITKRNELLFSLRKQASSRGFQQDYEEPSIFSLNFQERIQK